MITTEYRVSGMSCAHCENAIHDEVVQLDNVSDARADAQTGKLLVTSDVPLDDAQVLAAVDEAGYQAERV